ncbi:MAG TPA: hypothetical protein VI168_17620 [Croceibacterium sp.]
MATAASRQLKIGAIIDKTLGVIEHSIAPSLIYVVVLGAASAAVKYFSLGSTAILETLGVALATMVVSIAAAYFLLDAMVERTGVRTRGTGDMFLPYIGLSVLYSIAVGLGFIVVVIPGLLLMARWSIAQPLLVARGEGIMQSLGQSWEKTSGAEFKIIGAALLLLLLPVAAVIACSVMFKPDDLLGIALGQLASSAATVISLGMGVALYGMIEHAGDVAEPFR